MRSLPAVALVAGALIPSEEAAEQATKAVRGFFKKVKDAAVSGGSAAVKSARESWKDD